MNKRRWLSLCVSTALVVLGGLVAVSAQQPSPTAQPAQQENKSQKKPGDKGKSAGDKSEEVEPGQIRQITINVRLPVTITDSRTNRFITDLKQSDFEVFEDKTKQNIEDFRALNDLPLDVAILMDTSNSVKPKLKFEKDASVSFLYTMLQSRKDRALFATFDSEVELHQDFTNRLDLLTKAIDKVKAQGETRIYDAVHSVCEEKMAAIQGRRRAMIIITDGEDTASERTLKDAIDIAQRSETVVFVISTKAAGFFGVMAGQVDSKEDKVLKQLAEETGGRAFFTSQVIELEKSFSAIARELRSQYQITYIPANDNFDGKFRKIEVKLPGYKDYRIRTKSGYTAVPPRQVSTEAGVKQ
jgi:Ca-activated chloride channel family protein